MIRSRYFLYEARKLQQTLVRKLHLNTAPCVCDCCTVGLLRIESHPRGLAYDLFLTLSVCVPHAYLYYSSVSSVHIIICTHSDRKYKKLCDIITCIIPVPLNCVLT